MKIIKPLVYSFVIVVIIVLVWFFSHQNSKHGLPNQSPTLKISGTADADLQYKIRVKYIAQKDRFWCKDYSLGLYGSFSKTAIKNLDYYPDIKAGENNSRHEVNVPLNEYPPLQGCQYQPIRVYFMVARRPYEPMFKNTLLLNAEIYGHKSGKNPSVSQVLPEHINVSCFPLLRMPSEADDPNDHWRCYQDYNHTDFTHELTANKNAEIVMDIQMMTRDAYNLAGKK